MTEYRRSDATVLSFPRKVSFFERQFRQRCCRRHGKISCFQLNKYTGVDHCTGPGTSCTIEIVLGRICSAAKPVVPIGCTERIVSFKRVASQRVGVGSLFTQRKQYDPKASRSLTKVRSKVITFVSGLVGIVFGKLDAMEMIS